MGQLSDAIREHLELKRRHGASDDEVAREEAEALGPVRRQPEAAEPAAPAREYEDERDDAPLEAETALLGAYSVPHEDPVEVDRAAAEEPEMLEEEDLEPHALDEPRTEAPGPLDPLPPAEEPGAEDQLEEDVLDEGVLEEERLVADDETPAATADSLEVAEEPDEVAAVFPEPAPTVPDERMSVEEPPPIGPRPLVDEAPVVHDEPLAEEDAAPYEDVSLGEDVPHEDVPSAEAPFPSGEPGLEDPFATQPHALAPLSEDDEESLGEPPLLEDDEEPLGEPPLLEDDEEPLGGGPPALLEEDELELFEEEHGGTPAGAIPPELEEEPIEAVEEEDVAPSGAYEHGIDEPPDLDADPPRARPAPPPGGTDSFDFDA